MQDNQVALVVLDPCQVLNVLMRWAPQKFLVLRKPKTSAYGT